MNDDQEEEFIDEVIASVRQSGPLVIPEDVARELVRGRRRTRAAFRELGDAAIEIEQEDAVRRKAILEILSPHIEDGSLASLSDGEVRRLEALGADVLMPNLFRHYQPHRDTS